MNRTNCPRSRAMVVLSCVAIMMSLGILYLWSLFQAPVIAYLQWDASAVTMVPSVMLCCFTFGNFFGGFIGDRIGPRLTATLGGVLFLAGNVMTSFILPVRPQLIFFSYSGLAGFGVGFGYNTALSCIQKWFPENRGVGTGVAIAAFGLSTAVWAFPVEYLLSSPILGENAVPLTFRVIGLAFGGVVILAAQMLSNPPAVTAGGAAEPRRNHPRQYRPGEAIRCPEMWIACICMSLPMATYLMVNPIIKTLGMTRGLTSMEANLTISLTGVFSAIARLVCPAVSDRIGRSKVGIAMYFLNIVSALCLTFISGIPYIIVVQLATMAYGGPGGLSAIMISESFGTEHSGANSGITVLFYGIASFCFPKLSTVLYASSGSYTAAFIVGAAVCVPAIIAVSMYDSLHQKRMIQDAALMRRQ